MSEAGILTAQGKAEPYVSNEPAHRILIIDDEAAIRESLETLLTLEGYNVESCAGRTRLGLKMPSTAGRMTWCCWTCRCRDMNGLEILARIRERQPTLPVIMITAYGTVSQRRRRHECAGHRTSSRSRGTTRNCWQIFARLRRGSGRKKRMSSSSGR